MVVSRDIKRAWKRATFDQVGRVYMVEYSAINAKGQPGVRVETRLAERFRRRSTTPALKNWARRSKVPAIQQWARDKGL